MNEERSTRRGALVRGLAVLGGLVGLGAAGAAGAATGPTTIHLRARHMRAHARTARPGAHARTGDRLTVGAELLDRSGAAVGELHGAAFALRGPGSGAPERLELHTFVLRDGTVIGSGAGSATAGTFAILGGTGRYAGARGTYTIGPGRGGTAEIVLTVL